MKSIVVLGRARSALRKHRNIARRINDKLQAYAADPKASANRVTELRGRPLKRMRVGDFRILFEETEKEIIVVDIGPRGEIYDRQD
jgi:mRNA interferase RelE/StbE